MSRLAQRLGYRVVWADVRSVLPVVDQVRNTGAAVVVMPSPYHVDPLVLNRLMEVVDVETVLPRLSFARWVVFGLGR
ncbi:hypothetical protein [Nocardia callitridis]|uniref:hypothetical protein n=1 Tax=Nocardia callitridis TaxID=648753 RepID=UPI0031ECC70A